MGLDDLLRYVQPQAQTATGLLGGDPLELLEDTLLVGHANANTLVLHLHPSGSGHRPALVGFVVSRAVGPAVVRNRVKRQVREAYRCNKHSLAAAVAAMEGNKDLSLAFVWLDDNLHPSAEVEKRVQRLLQSLEEKL